MSSQTEISPFEHLKKSLEESSNPSINEIKLALTDFALEHNLEVLSLFKIDFRGREPQLLAAIRDYTSDQQPSKLWDVILSILGPTTPPPQPQTTSFPSTPYPRNSTSSTNLLTTHDKLNYLITMKLAGKTFIASTQSFLDQFCPLEDSSLPLPGTRFPVQRTEANVVRWFKEYQDQLDISQPNGWSNRTFGWHSSGSHALYHPYSKWKLDLFTYPLINNDQNGQRYGQNGQRYDQNGQRYNWSSVITIGELKQRTGPMGPHCSKNIIQLASYAREIFARQPGRRYVLGFILVNELMTCWVFLRSAVIGTEPFSLVEEDGLEAFSRVFYSFTCGKDLGLAGGDGLLHPTTIDISNTKYWINNPIDPFVRSSAIITRGTTYWQVRTSEKSEEPSPPLVLKNAWRYESRSCEGQLFEIAHSKGVEGVAVYHGHMDGENSGDITQHLLIIKTVKMPQNYFALDSRGSLLSQSQSQSNRPKKRTSSSHIEPGNPSKRRRGAPEGMDETITIPGCETIIIPGRICTYLVTSHGIPITKYASLQQLLEGMRDAVRGHQSLLDKVKILHRDISPNNIMMTDPQYPPRYDGFKGFLIDLDLAMMQGRDSPSGATEQTGGTYEFLSIELLEGNKYHGFYDDLQSFFFVFIYLVVKAGTVLNWDSPPQIAGAVKYNLVSRQPSATYQKQQLEWLLENTKHGLPQDVVVEVALRLRDAIWPKDVTAPRVSLSDIFYKKMIAAFDYGIAACSSRAV